MTSVFWPVFLVAAMGLWKIFGDFAPVEEYAGLDIRLIVGSMSIIAALGLAFSCHLIQVALEKEEAIKKLDTRSERKKPQPKFDELYETGEDGD